MMQITYGDNKKMDDRRRYGLHQATIKDSPTLKWRHFSVDATSHYIKLESLKRLVNAASIQKLNILMIKFGDGASFPLSFDKTP